MTRRLESFAQFWPIYLGAHRDPRTRAMHYLGTSLALLLLLVFAGTGSWRALAAAPVAGYAFAWLAHAVFERNQPATFQHPLWSLRGDFYMLYLWATRKLPREIERNGDL